ncbi:MAG: hypothetical protein MJ240_04595 [Kiritimatiellae bacterium]|nr:hypothetical protein [Kiritimatiellia bacterium]
MKTKLNYKLDYAGERFGGVYKAKMCARETVDAREILETAEALGSMNRALVRTYFMGALEVLVAAAAETGKIIRVGEYLTIEPHVRGRFAGVDAEFDPAQGHSVALTVKPGTRLKSPKTALVPENVVKPIRARVDSVASDGGSRPNRLVFGRDIVVLGRNLDLLEGDAVTWQVKLPSIQDPDGTWQPGAQFAGTFDVLANDPCLLRLKGPESLPETAVGRTLDLAIHSRGGNREACRRLVVRHCHIERPCQSGDWAVR